MQGHVKLFVGKIVELLVVRVMARRRHEVGMQVDGAVVVLTCRFEVVVLVFRDIVVERSLGVDGAADSVVHLRLRLLSLTWFCRVDCGLRRSTPLASSNQNDRAISRKLLCQVSVQ